MRALITMVAKVHDFAGTRKAAEKYALAIQNRGCNSLRIYRTGKDPDEALQVME